VTRGVRLARLAHGAHPSPARAMVHTVPGIGPRSANAACEGAGPQDAACQPDGPPQPGAASADGAGADAGANPWAEVYRAPDDGTAARLAALRSWAAATRR